MEYEGDQRFTDERRRVEPIYQMVAMQERPKKIRKRSGTSEDISL